MPTINFDLEVYCTCGKSVQAREDGNGRLEVEPCDSCLSQQYDEGFANGEAQEGTAEST